MDRARLWIYDLRTNQHFTQQQNPLHRSPLDESDYYFANGEPRPARTQSERGWR